FTLADWIFILMVLYGKSYPPHLGKSLIFNVHTNTRFTSPSALHIFMALFYMCFYASRTNHTPSLPYYYCQLLCNHCPNIKTHAITAIIRRQA
ncbi:hypothetical protein, partial [Sulfuriflexus sp.]|uniref:hypothetical protein n=1 Tax=Sulfuriflexus sp. TaxID=2015443 RepID=UPI0028CE220A